jgi:ribosomal protein S12 methylthiotransferase accessory factor
MKDMNVSVCPTVLVVTVPAIRSHFADIIDMATAAARREHDCGIDFDVLGLPGAPIAGPGRHDGRILPLRLAFAAGHPLALLVGPVGRSRRPCLSCLGRRWLALRSQKEIAALRTERDCGVLPTPWWSEFAASAVEQLVRFVLQTWDANTPADPLGLVYELQLPSLSVARRLLLTDGDCDVCSPKPADQPAAAVLELQSRQKPSERTYRVKHGLAIDLPTDAFANPTCGALGAAVVGDPTHGFSAQATGFYNELTAKHPPVAWSGHRQRYTESVKLAFLEGLERHAGLVPRNRRVTVFDTLRNLGADALDPRRCGVYEPGCYGPRTGLTPFDDDLAVHWVWGYSLTEHRPILVPAQLVYYGDAAGERLFVRDNSNGCAAGSCLEEAILHGLLELVERDAFVISWYATLSLPRIDPWSCSAGEVRHLLDRVVRKGYDVHLLDARLDIKVPTIIAYMRRRDRELGAMSLASGCNFDPEQALRMALGEITSHSVGHARRVMEDEALARRMMADYGEIASMTHHTLVYGLPEMADRADYLHANPVVRSFAETYADWDEWRPHSLDMLDDLQFCIDHLVSRGLDQVIVVDQTSAEQRHFNTHTACVIVPGLAPIDFGYYFRRCTSLSRLYTAPRIAGFRDSDLTIDELNPLPHMFP